ncbi:hypothetical protein CDD81_7163 [Ophiocordyceps australis]|uniref:OPT family small oligopeptide transporter n=1 Tax=Ophiocordyceps australis TaxID=1399860 RepID=A0A2C5Y654_9HYPO|nr:hypothetical protein CDD81_7163 [Ophiocordyceps australis]
MASPASPSPGLPVADKSSPEPLATKDPDAASTSGPLDEASVSEGDSALYTVGNPCTGQAEAVAATDPRIAPLPGYVRRVVSLVDDVSEPTLTFRYFVLTVLFVAPGAFLSQMAHFRTTYAPYSVFFVQIASNYAGAWLARVLPRRRFTIPLPFTGKRGGERASWSWSLNPGPWSTKEHVLVTISAASGATYNLGYTPLAMSELYFGQPVHGVVAILFMLAITWTGYSYAALARQFLIYDPQYPWFQALCQTALFETQRKQRQHPTALSRKQTRVFFAVLAAVTAWQFLPEFVFPMLGSLAFLCWVAPHNKVANFLGAGFGGAGLLNFSLDWSSISVGSDSGGAGSLFLTPWWTQVVVFCGFVTGCWILLPAAKWGGMTLWDHGLMSNRVFQANGSAYPLRELLTPDMRLNQTAYDELGPLYVGAQYLWNMFFDYASYSSALVWMLLFGGDQLRASLGKFFQRQRRRQGPKQEAKQAPGAGDERDADAPSPESTSSEAAPKITEQFQDQLNVLQRAYDEIPTWWFAALFAVSFVIMVVITARGLLFVPVWTYFVAIATGAIVVVPLGWLYALSNFQLAIGSTNELWYGLMINSISGHKNPCGASTYGAIAGDAWYRAQLNLQDMKIGHYMHIPPRAVFFSQVFGSLIGIPIDYAVIRWVLATKAPYLAGTQEDPSRQWTGQALASSLTKGVQYVLVGPVRIFQQQIYRPVPYGFLVGAVAPCIVYALHRRFPHAKLHLANTTIFFSSLAAFRGNISTGYASSFVGGFVVMYFAYRYRYAAWARWNYILAAAFDAGFNLNMLLIFLCFGAARVVKMAHWWGNDAKSSERCFALDD